VTERSFQELTGGDAEGGAGALRVRGVSKSFPGTRALRDVDLDLASAEVHGLVGENGCGKSTLVKIIAGVYQGDTGTVEVGGQKLQASEMSPSTSRQLGIRVVHQDSPIFPTLTVTENLLLGGRFPVRRGGRIDWREARRRAAVVLERFHIEARPDALAADLDFAVRGMVAIARELQDSEEGERGILVLDEPTARLNEEEVDTLLAALRRYAADGQGIVLVTHRLDEVMEVCDRLTVMRDGRVVATRGCEDLDRRTLVEMIVGSALAGEYAAARHEVDAESAGEIVARVRGLSSTTLREIDLDLPAGEIVGLAGVEGSGTSELLQTIYGCHPRAAGTVEVRGRELPAGQVRRARELGVEYVPPDRAADAAFSGMTVRENLSVGELGRYWRNGRMSRSREAADVAELIERFQISPPTGDALMSNLSGGNQQKVVLARAFRREPTLLLLDEPSNGVDVGARAQIHHAIRAAVDKGATALIASSDAEELTRLCDRILIFVEGRITSELRGEGIVRDSVLTLIHQSSDEAESDLSEASA